jgi:hypothetical protein
MIKLRLLAITFEAILYNTMQELWQKCWIFNLWD